VWSGVGLVTLGVVVNLSAIYRHFQIVHQLSSGTWIPGKVSKDAVILAILLACVGIGMALYLTLVH
jgi:putative membrane protein